MEKKDSVKHQKPTELDIILHGLGLPSSDMIRLSGAEIFFACGTSFCEDCSNIGWPVDRQAPGGKNNHIALCR